MYHFTFTDLNKLALILFIFRFIKFLLKYNFRTTFYIMALICIASLFWYFHLLAVLNFHSDIINRFFSLTYSLIKQKENYNLDLKLQKIYQFLLDKYYIDPIAMIISILYKPIRIIILPFYYLISNVLIPNSYNFILDFWSLFGPVIRFLIVIRHGRNFLPYFIKWHWGFIFFLKLIEKSYLSLCQRSTYFCETFQILADDFEDEHDDMPSFIYVIQVYLAQTWLLALFFFHIGLMYYGLVHAIFGQYFYFPYITFNLNEHVGRRVGKDLLDDLTYSPFYSYYIKN